MPKIGARREAAGILIAYGIATASATLASLYGFMSASGYYGLAKGVGLCCVAFVGCHGPAWIAKVKREMGWPAALVRLSGDRRLPRCHAVWRARHDRERRRGSARGEGEGVRHVHARPRSAETPVGRARGHAVRGHRCRRGERGTNRCPYRCPDTRARVWQRRPQTARPQLSNPRDGGTD